MPLLTDLRFAAKLWLNLASGANLAPSHCAPYGQMLQLAMLSYVVGITEALPVFATILVGYKCLREWKIYRG